MEYNIDIHKKCIGINYISSPIWINNSWSILNSNNTTIYYYFDNNREGWKYGEILPVIICYNKHQGGNCVYYNNHGRIIPLNMQTKFNLYNNIYECILNGIDYWLNYIHNLLNTHNKHIYYSNSKYTKLYTEFLYEKTLSPVDLIKYSKIHIQY